MTNKTCVAVIKHNDKFTALDQVLAQTHFLNYLQGHWVSSGKKKVDFCIVIKPNIMMANSKDDPSTITDPALVEHLIDGIVNHGFTNVVVVESQNVYSNWFQNREVLTVARYFGYSELNYRLVDLTQEMVPYNYGGRLGSHPVGPTWRDADFRISFAKNKTHLSCYFTLTIKNLYGCMPMQNKMKEYHEEREFDWPTIEMLKHFPCHYGLIDAIWSADGLLGLKEDYSPHHTKTIIGGESILAVDWVGAKKMGLDPYRSRMFERATAILEEPDVEWIGDQSIYKDWTNVSPLIDMIVDVGEEGYVYANWLGFISSSMDPTFPPKTRHRLSLFIRTIVTAALRFLSRVEGLRIFKVRTTTASMETRVPVGVEIDHRFSGIVRPLTRWGIINIFELAATNLNYAIDKYLETE